MEGVRPLGQTLGCGAVWLMLFMITGFHGTHVTIGDFPDRHRAKVLAGRLRCRKARLFQRAGESEYEDASKSPALYWHFVDLVWVVHVCRFSLCGEVGA